MLESVYNYNVGFIKSEEEKNLLLKILKAMSIIDRKFFVSDKDLAYYDTALSIGEGQTISQPSTMARMLILARLKKGDDILEVGTGSGWNSCLISFLVYPGNVISIEKNNNLIKKAKENIKNLKRNLKQQDKEKLKNLKLKNINIFSFKSEKKFNKIIITAGINKQQEEKIKNLALNFLKEKGILICPYQEGPLIIFKKNKKLEKEKTKEEYVFVPLRE